MECPALCHGHGDCVVGECDCHQGYIGTTCDVLECPRGCSGHGNCVPRNYTDPVSNTTVSDGVDCVCQEGWGGDDGDCRINMKCIDNCGFEDGRGKCQEGRCYCADGYGGAGCQERLCMDGCNGHGTCVTAGTTNDPHAMRCQCASSWGGELCDVRECPRGTTKEECSGHGLCFRHVAEPTQPTQPTQPTPQNAFSNALTAGQTKATHPHTQYITGAVFHGDHAPLPTSTISHPPVVLLEETAKKLRVVAECVCANGYSGLACEHQKCPGDGTCHASSKQGHCNTDTGLCECVPSYGGEECGLKVCPGVGPQECSGHGTCHACT
jgi:tenascin